MQYYVCGNVMQYKNEQLKAVIIKYGDLYYQ